MRDTIEAGEAVQRIGMSLAIAGCMAIAGCAAASKVVEIADIPLQAVGLSKPSVPAPPPLPPPRIRDVRLEIDAATDLNADDRGRGLALIAHVYKLRDTTAFMQTPLARFLNPDDEKTALGSDRVDVHEIVLTPGQQFETHEMLGNDSPWLGVVAFFRKPAPYRWRFVFKTDDIEKTGVRIGAHACALTVTAGLAGSDAESRPLDQLPPFCP